jgi:hypothetical protein
MHKRWYLTWQDPDPEDVDSVGGVALVAVSVIPVSGLVFKARPYGGFDVCAGNAAKSHLPLGMLTGRDDQLELVCWCCHCGGATMLKASLRCSRPSMSMKISQSPGATRGITDMAVNSTATFPSYLTGSGPGVSVPLISMFMGPGGLIRISNSIDWVSSGARTLPAIANEC